MPKHVSWTDAIEQHPAFQTLTKLPGAADIPPKRLCAFEAALFFAVGKTVRWIDCSAVKGSNPSEQYEYKTIQVTDVDYDILQICSSPNGRYLALVGEKKVVVISIHSLHLPNPARNQQSEGNADVSLLPDSTLASFSVPSDTSDDIHIASSSSVCIFEDRVVEAKFHPYSKSDKCLVVLTETELQLLEVRRGFVKPDFTVGFSDISANGTFSAFLDEREPAGFCFSSSRLGWGLCTVYVIMKNGDIQMICPVLPKYSVLTRAQCQDLATFVKMRHKEQPTEMTRQQLRWITTILGEISLERDFHLRTLDSSVYDADDRELVVVQRPSNIHLEVALQEPFLLQPAGQDYSETADACGLVSLGVEPMDVLMSVNTAGIVSLWLIVSEVQAEWRIRARMHELSSRILSHVHSFSLGVTTPYAVLEKDVHSNAVVHIYHASGVHTIDCRHWVEELSQAFEDGAFPLTTAEPDSEAAADEEVEREDEDTDGEETDRVQEVLGTISETTMVQQRLETDALHEGKGDAVFGLASLRHPLYGPALVAITRDTCVSVMSDPLAPMDARALSAAEGTALVDASTNMLDSLLLDPELRTGEDASLLIPQYSSLLTPPVFRRPELPDASLRFVVPSGLRGPLSVDADTLRYFSTVVAQTREALVAVQEGTYRMHERLDLQAHELLRQFDRVREYTQRVQHLRDQSVPLDRIQELVERQKALESRTDKVLQRFMEHNVPELSDQEKAFIKEIERCKTRVLGERGYVARLDELKARVQRLQQQRKLSPNVVLPSVSSFSASAAISSSFSPSSPLSIKPSELTELQNLLKRQQQRISDLKKRTLAVQRVI
ncbi:nucleoporin Nup82 [Schizosaccharomyces japonicus yFS275]|uniref:Nucleoporin Nup82 n=1 Tax=Schizosaccharomyces japonicus (strain yFS275 / FY16936) TaxID=402676 RepID=B6JXD7_SCHJY|nr:nucleoporin Nup82 [Schizosaccharomyces japonicus yFS275]EEB06038.1 nucleoporin Nup82 [Schizosaccharomyces japonicus yFS275]